MFDIWALAAALPGSVRFVAKQELVKVPLLGRAMVAAGRVVIDKFNLTGALEAYVHASAVVRGGISRVGLPVSSPSHLGELLSFHYMAVVHAHCTGRPIF